MQRKVLVVGLLALVLPASAWAGITVTGDSIEVNYCDQGTWNWRSAGAGLMFRDLPVDPWIDFTYPGNPWQYIVVEFDDSSGPHVHRAWVDGSTFTSVDSESDDSAGSVNVAHHSYTASVLEIHKWEVWDDSDRGVYVEFRVTNTDTVDVSDFRIIHAVDPDQGSPTSLTTYNDVLDLDGDTVEEWVESSYPAGGMTIGYGTCDTADELGYASWSTDADVILSDLDGVQGDLQMYWRHRESTITAGSSVRFGFYVSVDLTPTRASRGFGTAATTYCPGCDGDGDMHLASLCAGDDCDDTDATRHPGHTEWCDGVDNDCDSTTDDGSGEPWLGTYCDGPDTDWCAEGRFECSSGRRVCTDTTGNNPDTCDGSDDDCNPTTPDGSGETWYGGPCDGPDSDSCEEGTADCVSGAMVCSDDTGDEVDLCDGVDNDCDSSTADGSAETWFDTPCDGADADECEEGVYICSGGVQTCDDETDDTVEVCDGLDNDCDGRIDEGGVCYDTPPDTSTDTGTDSVVTDTMDDLPGDVPPDGVGDPAPDIAGDTDVADTAGDGPGSSTVELSRGCGCQVVGGRASASGLVLLTLALGLLGPRRRK